MKNRIFLAISALLFITGCAAKWHKPGATDADFYNDRAMCINMANNMWPANQSPIGTGYTTPISTSCNRIGNYVNCQQTGGQYTPPATMDTNAIARAVEVRQCLQAKGYTPQ